MNRKIKFETRHGQGSAAFTHDQATGAIPNGTLVFKCNTEPKDGHVDGSPAHVLGSIGPVDGVYGYFVEWLDKPNTPTFIAGTRIREYERTERTGD